MDVKMNDFTKEELEALTIAIHHLRMLKIQREEFYIGLQEKLQSMIDNYCEHDWHKGVHLFNDVYCTKCKLHFEVNNEV